MTNSDENNDPAGQGGRRPVSQLDIRIQERIAMVRSSRKHALLSTVGQLIDNLEKISALLRTLSDVTNTLRTLRETIDSVDIGEARYPALVADVESLMAAIDTSLQLLLEMLIISRDDTGTTV